MFTLPQISSTHDLNNAEIFFHQNYLAANAHQVLEYNHDFIGAINEKNPSPILSKTIPEKSQTVRKDRHSKIFTSQGPRDRRVRLSIAIARKFFDLQEMLGFDKPSKTLDWLLTESKASIKDLILKKKSQNGGVVSSSPSECEVISSRNLLENGSYSKRKSVCLSAKEMRVKARARARERTREKMCIKQLNEAIRKNGYDLSPSIPIHHMNNNTYYNGGISESIFDYPINYDASSNHEDLIHESILIRRKFKQYPPSIFGFQHNVIFSRDSTSNVMPFTTQSDVWAILDQHN